MRSIAVLAAASLAALTATSPALARGGRDDGRVVRSASCGSATTGKLELKRDGGAIEVAFEVDRRRTGERWRVSLAQDGRVTHRGTGRTGGRSAAFSFERRLRDLPGADRITARASGPSGVTCTATATLPSG